MELAERQSAALFSGQGGSGLCVCRAGIRGLSVWLSVWSRVASGMPGFLGLAGCEQSCSDYAPVGVLCLLCPEEPAFVAMASGSQAYEGEGLHSTHRYLNLCYWRTDQSSKLLVLRCWSL
jgi:hypothetical protein